MKKILAIKDAERSEAVFKAEQLSDEARVRLNSLSPEAFGQKYVLACS